jgi:protoporphyrinogen oxidase
MHAFFSFRLKLPNAAKICHPLPTNHKTTESKMKYLSFTLSIASLLASTCDTGAAFVVSPPRLSAQTTSSFLGKKNSAFLPQTTSQVSETSLFMVRKGVEKGLELKKKQEELQKLNDGYVPSKAQRFNKWEELLDPDYTPKVTDKIAIVGAGPAGLHMAFKLNELGFQHVTVLEKDVRIAGKSFTEYIYEKEVPQEFGTCYTIPYKYQELRRIAAATGNVFFEEIPVPERHVYTDYTDKEPITQTEWLISSKKKKFPFRLLPDIASELAVAVDMLRFVRGHNSLFAKPIDDIISATNMDLKTWLIKNGFDDLIPVISLANTVQGYGYIDRVPALYGLWWNSPAEIEGFLATKLRMVKQPASILRNGFVQYWEWIYNSGRVNVKEGFEISKMERSDDGVVIIDKDGNKHDYDFCVITCNLKDALSFLDTRPEEREIFDGLQDRSNLITTLFSCKHSTDPVAISSWTTSLDPQKQARLMTVRNSAKIFFPEDVGTRDRDFLISYQYVEDARPNATEYRQELEDTLLNDLKAAGFKDIEVHEQKVWPYFQRWTQEGLNKGLPVKVMQRQGSLRTWFAGASTLFESVHDCMEYNLALTSTIDKQRSENGGFMSTAPSVPKQEVSMTETVNEEKIAVEK